MLAMTVRHLRSRVLPGPGSSGRGNRTEAETLRQAEKDGDKDGDYHVHQV
jgi:hypothetical protein